MRVRLKAQLSTFMFLQYFTWGAWYVSMGADLANVLGFEGQQVGAAYGTFAIGAMITPFFVGLVADRYFATERLLSLLGVAGGVLLLMLPHCQRFGTFYPLLIAYCASFAPSWPSEIRCRSTTWTTPGRTSRGSRSSRRSGGSPAASP